MVMTRPYVVVQNDVVGQQDMCHRRYWNKAGDHLHSSTETSLYVY